MFLKGEDCVAHHSEIRDIRYISFSAWKEEPVVVRSVSKNQQHELGGVSLDRILGSTRNAGESSQDVVTRRLQQVNLAFSPGVVVLNGLNTQSQL